MSFTIAKRRFVSDSSVRSNRAGFASGPYSDDEEVPRGGTPTSEAGTYVTICKSAASSLRTSVGRS